MLLTKLTRLACFAMFAILISYVLVAAESKKTGPWICGLRPGDPPREQLAEEAGRLLDRDTAYWAPDRAIVVVQAGKPAPVDAPRGEPFSVTVRDLSGAPAADTRIAWRPADVPNLPEPLGRTRTDAKGRAEIRAMPNQQLVVWIDDSAYAPGSVRKSPDSQSLVLTRVPAVATVVRVRDAFGRDLAGAQLLLLDPKVFSDPMLLAQNRSAHVSLIGDEFGRVDIPSTWDHASGWAVADEASIRGVASVGGARRTPIVLDGAPELLVSVTDSDGKPVADVDYELAVPVDQVPWLPFHSRGRWSAEPGVLSPPGYPCQLTVSAKGFPQVRQSLDKPPTRKDVVIVLSRGVVLSGIVEDQTGRAIEGATVMVQEADPPAEASTNGKGRFELPPLSGTAGPFTLIATAKGYLPGELPRTRAVTTEDLRIIVQRGGAITGRAVDQDTNDPVANARAELRAAGRIRGRTKTAADGTFQFVGLSDDTYLVRVKSAGRLSAAQEVKVLATAPLDLGEVRLSEHPRVHGRLVAPIDESRVAEVRLERIAAAEDLWGAERPEPSTTTSAADGTFVLTGVSPGRYRLIAVSERARASRSPIVVAGSDLDLGELRLAAPGTVKGQIVTRNVDPGGWRIALLNNRFDLAPQTTYTDGEGQFTLEDVVPGSYRIAAYAPLHMQPDAARAITVDPGAELSVRLSIEGLDVVALVSVDGVPANKGKLIVSAPRDELFDGMIVVLVSDDGARSPIGLPSAEREGIVDDAGKAVLHDVPPGPAQATLLSEGQFRMAVTIPDSLTGPLYLNFTGLSLSGRVLSIDGTPQSQLPVTWGYAGVGIGPGNREMTDANGRFVLTGLGEGKIAVICGDEAHGTARAEVTLISASPTQPLEMRLSK